jgi:tRNA threonylcarbamoyladenosine biosynthesis protein TsaE
LVESSTSILETRRVAWPDEAACAATARAMAGHAALRDAFVELHGPLGAGKTTFARHLLHGLGVAGAIKSPTYALMEPYRTEGSPGGHDVAHFDFYRFDDPQEWEDAGFREVFANPGLKLVEWPEKAEGLLPGCDLRVRITPRDGSDAREARFEALTETGRELLP